MEIAYLPPRPVDDAIRITAIETVVVPQIMPGLLLLRIHTEADISGDGDTYYAPQAVASLIHDWMAHRLLGGDALAIESHWRFFYERFANFGVCGAELRAISGNRSGSMGHPGQSDPAADLSFARRPRAQPRAGVERFIQPVSQAWGVSRGTCRRRLHCDQDLAFRCGRASAWRNVHTT